MSNLKFTVLLAGVLTVATVPAAFAVENGTTLGGNAKDNSASGGSEASGTSKAGGAMAKKKTGGTMMKKSGAMSGATGK